MSTQPPSGDIRRAVIASLVASILVLLVIQPAIRAFYTLLAATGSRYVDSAYRNASLGHRNWVEVLFFMGIYSVALGAATALLILSRRWGRERVKASRRVLTILNYPLFALALFVWGGFIASSYVDLQLNASFEQRLTVLAPVLSEEEEEGLRAEWASMTSRVDYLEIMRKVEALAQARGVRLPPRLLR